MSAKHCISFPNNFITGTWMFTGQTDLHLVRFCPFGFSAELDNKERVCIVLMLWGCNLCLCIIIVLLSYFEMKSSWNYIICELPGKVSPSCAPWNLGVLKLFYSCLPGECLDFFAEEDPSIVMSTKHIINLRATLSWFWNSLISNKTTVLYNLYCFQYREAVFCPNRDTCVW